MNATTNSETAVQGGTKIHVFERAGLGLAPFKFLGQAFQDMAYGQAILNREEYNRTGVMITTKPGGTCAYCGQYIVAMFDVQSADGKKFHVGSDCILKTGDAGLRTAVNKIKAHTQATREAARITAAAERLADPELRETLEALPHPQGFKNRATGAALTLLDWVNFMMQNGGHSGKLKATRAIEKAVTK